MLYDADKGQLKHTKVERNNKNNNNENNKNVSILSGVPKSSKGYVPHFVLAYDTHGYHLRIAQISNHFFGKHIQNLF